LRANWSARSATFQAHGASAARRLSDLDEFKPTNDRRGQVAAFFVKQ
jgi:hypothetical protein